MAPKTTTGWTITRLRCSSFRSPKEQRTPATTPRPSCLACDKPLRRYKHDDRAREWGDYGDNRFCGLTCGWKWACRRAPMPRAPKEKK